MWAVGTHWMFEQEVTRVYIGRCTVYRINGRKQVIDMLWSQLLPQLSKNRIKTALEVSYMTNNSELANVKLDCNFFM